nr:LysR family transcriptional regulator [Herbaspirillum sp. ASV7]
MKYHDRHTEIEAFVAIAKFKNFGMAAYSLAMTASAITRKLQSLEARLATRLFQRTTRRITLTEAGQRYLLRCEQWLAQLQDADAEIAELRDAVHGCLRVSVPVNYGRLKILPALSEFMDRYPALKVDIDFTDRYVDLLDERIDVAVRVGRLEDSRLVARKLGDNQRMLVAAPDYLARHGMPQHPRELLQHSCLHFAYYMDGDTWRLEREGEWTEIPVTGRLRANNAEALYTAALAGAGIMQSAKWIVGQAVAEGCLIPVLTQWRPQASQIWAIYPSARYLSPKVRAFVDFYVDKLAEAEP